MNGTGPTDTTTWSVGSPPSSSPIIFILPTGFGIRVRAHRRFDAEHPFTFPRPPERTPDYHSLLSGGLSALSLRSLGAPGPSPVVSPIAPHPPVCLATANPLVSPATPRQPISLLVSHPPSTPWRRRQRATPPGSGRCKLMTSLSRAFSPAPAHWPPGRGWWGRSAGGCCRWHRGAGLVAQVRGQRVRMRLRLRGPVGEICRRDSRVEMVFQPAFARRCSYRNEQAPGLSGPTVNSNTPTFSGSQKPPPPEPSLDCSFKTRFLSFETLQTGLSRGHV